MGDPREMREAAVGFYSQLYSGEVSEDVLMGPPHTDRVNKAKLDSQLIMQELTVAMQKIAAYAPGIDELPVDYKRFWGYIGVDFYEMLLECMEVGELPASCRWAVLTLLPKDLCSLKNWQQDLVQGPSQPLGFAGANRLIVLCPRLLCNVQFVFSEGIGTGWSGGFRADLLDQEKAFDQVSHEYLYGMLKAFGVGDPFISSVRLLYKGASLVWDFGASTAPRACELLTHFKRSQFGTDLRQCSCFRDFFPLLFLFYHSFYLV